MKRKADQAPALRAKQLTYDLGMAKVELTDSPVLTHALHQLTVDLENPRLRALAALEMDANLRAKMRRKIAIAVPAVALGLLAIPVAAVAVSSWTAHSGTYGDPATSTEVVDRSEWLGLDAPDAPAAVAALYDYSLPLPKGASPSDVITPVADLLKKMGMVPEGESGHETIQESTVGVLFEKAARCLWYREWLESDLVGNTSDRQAATMGIREAASWPATEASDGGGVVDHLKSVADAAAAGKRAAVRDAYASCETYYGPASK